MSVLLFPYFFWNPWFSFVSSWFQLFHFYQESFDWFSVVLWKRFDFWSLELDTRNYLIEIWIFEIWDFGLKFDILKNWNLEFWKFVTWNFEHEIWSLKFLQLEILGILNVKIGHLECGILNLGMKILNWKFGIWDLKKTWNLNLKFYP